MRPLISVRRRSFLTQLGSLLATAVALAACTDDSGPTSPLRVTPRGSAQAAPGKAEPIPDSYIVTLDDSVSDVEAAAKRFGERHGGRIGYAYTRAMRGFSINLPAQAAAQLARAPGIARVEPNHTMQLIGSTQSFPPWHLDRIDQPDLPLNQAYAYAGTAGLTTVYIIDSGVRTTHVEFGGRAVPGFDPPDGAGPIDYCGHGTHVAGIVGAATYGVAKQAKIVSVRVFRSGSCEGSTADLIAGINWIIANRRLPAVANISLEFKGTIVLSVETAVNNLIAAGVTTVVGAGNSGFDACIQTPQRVPAAITVAASDISDSRAWFSNYGPCVDIFAPGVSVLSTWNTSNTASEYLNGTSMASPVVAGVVALAQELSPSLATGYVINGATLNRISNVGPGTPNRLINAANMPISCGGPCIIKPPDERFQRVTIGGPYAGTEGAPVSFALSGGTDPTLTYTWNFGDFSTASGPSATHTYADNETYVVTLTAADALNPANSIVLNTTVVVSNAAPVVQAGADFSAASGSLVTLPLSFTDAGALDGPWSYRIDWSDGTPASVGTTSTGGSVTATHVFRTAKPYTVRVTVTDKDGSVGSDDVIVTVNRIAIGVDALPGASPNTIRLGSKPNEVIQVAVLSSATFDAASIDGATATLGDGLGTDAGAQRDKRGQAIVSVADVNGDGRADRIYSFVKSDLVAAGDLTTATVRLTFLATLSDGRQVAGSDAVTVAR